MANIMRWRYGDTSPIHIPAQKNRSVEIGDLIILDGHCYGVAMQVSPIGDNGPIRVATTGVFEFPITGDEGDVIVYNGPQEVGLKYIVGKRVEHNYIKIG